MKIQVKNTLTKSRHPTEYNFNLSNKVGEILQVVGDGYCLIEFNDLLLKMPVKEKKRTMYKLVHLQWYIHENDFFIKL